MISRQDILDRSAEWRLRPEVVEKDYVLGWLLAGLAALPAREHWIFKGGTCIKKCYFETYRFSEDLDFSLLPEAAYAEEELRAGLVALARTTHDLSGIMFLEDLVGVRPRRNRQGQQTYECRIAYRGPLVFPGEPRRVLFDLTQHEVILAEPDERGVLHPYPDFLPAGATVRTYAFDELLGEKTRALFERARPRDLYDVVYLLENQPESAPASFAPRLDVLLNGVDHRHDTQEGYGMCLNASLVATASPRREITLRWEGIKRLAAGPVQAAEAISSRRAEEASGGLST